MFPCCCSSMRGLIVDDPCSLWWFLFCKGCTLEIGRFIVCADGLSSSCVQLWNKTWLQLPILGLHRLCFCCWIIIPDFVLDLHWVFFRYFSKDLFFKFAVSRSVSLEWMLFLVLPSSLSFLNNRFLPYSK